jgi:hypothetical protein
MMDIKRVISTKVKSMEVSLSRIAVMDASPRRLGWEITMIEQKEMYDNRE